MTNENDEFNVRVPGYRFRENTDGTSSKIDVEKEIVVKKEDIFVNGIDFNITAAEEYFKRATERQQILQAINLFASMGVLKDPMTGKERIYTDENGQQVLISELAIMEKVLNLFDMEECIKPVESMEPEQSPELPPMAPPAGAAPGGAMTPSVPNLSATPTDQAINTAAINQIQGGV